MATSLILHDDFDPTITTDVETVSFGFRGKEYTVDVGIENLKQMEEFFGDYINAGRPAAAAVTAGTKRPRGAPKAGAVQTDAAKIREWAAQNGFTGPDGGELPKRGRIAADIREAYEKAHPEA